MNDIIKLVLRHSATHGDLDLVFLIKDNIKCNIEWSEIFRLMFPFVVDYNLPLFYESPTEYLMSYYINVSRHSKDMIAGFGGSQSDLDIEMLEPLSKECMDASICTLLRQSKNTKWKHWIVSCYRALYSCMDYVTYNLVNATHYYVDGFLRNYDDYIGDDEIREFTRDIYIEVNETIVKDGFSCNQDMTNNGCLYVAIFRVLFNHYIECPVVCNDNPDYSELSHRRSILNVLKCNVVDIYKKDPQFNCLKNRLLDPVDFERIFGVEYKK